MACIKQYIDMQSFETVSEISPNFNYNENFTPKKEAHGSLTMLEKTALEDLTDPLYTVKWSKAFSVQKMATRVYILGEKWKIPQ